MAHTRSSGGTWWPLPNVWLGTSVENQQTADERIPLLLKCPAAVRFLSCEPLIGPIPKLPLDGIHWVIVGGESGPHARPCRVDWIRSIVRQCAAAGVPCFVKQLGARIRLANDSHDEWPRGGDGLIYEVEGPGFDYQGELHVASLTDPKGGDLAEWPADLRVRQWPETSR